MREERRDVWISSARGDALGSSRYLQYHSGCSSASRCSLDLKDAIMAEAVGLASVSPVYYE